MCALQASKTIIAGGKEHGFSLFQPTFHSGKLLLSIAAEIMWSRFFPSTKNIYDSTKFIEFLFLVKIEKISVHNPLKGHAFF